MGIYLEKFANSGLGSSIKKLGDRFQAVKQSRSLYATRINENYIKTKFTVFGKPLYLYLENATDDKIGEALNYIAASFQLFMKEGTKKPLDDGLANILSGTQLKNLVSSISELKKNITLKFTYVEYRDKGIAYIMYFQVDPNLAAKMDQKKDKEYWVDGIRFEFQCSMVLK